MREDDHISVLFIDSHDIDRNYYGDRLKIYSYDYVIFQAASGQAGISLFETVSIGCVVLEIDLADMSGIEVLVQLVPTRPPKIPIIVLTRLTNPFLLELAVKNGAVAALCKTRRLAMFSTRRFFGRSREFHWIARKKHPALRSLSFCFLNRSSHKFVPLAPAA